MATTRKPKSKVQHNGRTTRRDVAAEVTAKMIAALKDGKIPWQWTKSWTVTGIGAAPRSLASGKLYRGVNALLLMLAAQDNGWQSSQYGTYNQMAELAGMVPTVVGKNKDGSDRIKFVSPLLEDGTVDPTPRGVRKGESSIEIVWTNIWRKEEWDADLSKMVTRKIPLLKFFHVFNLDQCEFPEGTKGAKLLAKSTAKPEKEFNPVESAEALVAEYLANGPSLAYGGNSAHYVPATDHVQMPTPASFETSEHFYSTLYHELTHSTGHDSRLKREGIAKGTFGAFGSQVYSSEELVAEMGAAMLCSLAGIHQAAIFNNSAAYIKSWISKLEEDDRLIIKAAGLAQKAVDRILGTTFEDEEVAA